MPVWWERLRDVMSMRPYSHDALPDLRGLDSRRVRIERTYYLANDRHREHRGERMYVLRHDPKSTHDRSTVPVYENGRAIGFLPADAAAGIAPALDQLGGAAVVTGLGATPDSSRLWLHLPTVDALEAYATDSATDDAVA